MIVTMVAVAVVGLAALSPCIAGATVPQAPSSQHAPPPPQMRLDINRATIQELQKVPGMTRTWAERIVRFRPYRTKQDLLDQGVVSGEVYYRIKDYIIAHREKQ